MKFPVWMEFDKEERGAVHLFLSEKSVAESCVIRWGRDCHVVPLMWLYIQYLDLLFGVLNG